MAERKSWAVSAPAGEITTLDARHALSALMWTGSSAMVKRNGRIPRGSGTSFEVTATTPTPDGFVHVSPGHLWMMGTRSIAPYACSLDAIKDINILSTPAHGSLTRWDLIIAQQNDTLHSDADNTFTVKQVVGTPSATPADPTVTGSPDYVVLARVVVGAGVTTITQANITQLFTGYAVAAGGILPIANQAERDALGGTRYAGMTIWRVDRKWFEVFDGSNFIVIGTAVCTSTADRDSVITSPYNGQEAFTTDTGTLWLRHNSAWVDARTVGIGAELHAVKSTNKTVNNSSALSNDTQLQIPVVANATYKFDGFFRYSADTAADAQFAVTGPAGGSAAIAGHVLDIAENTAQGTIFMGIRDLGGAWNAAGGGLGSANERTCSPKGQITIGGTSGNITVQFAQRVATANDAVLYAKSYISLKRIA